jgi:hypothetical protein
MFQVCPLELGNFRDIASKSIPAMLENWAAITQAPLLLSGIKTITHVPVGLSHLQKKETNLEEGGGKAVGKILFLDVDDDTRGFVEWTLSRFKANHFVR